MASSISTPESEAAEHGRLMRAFERLWAIRCKAKADLEAGLSKGNVHAGLDVDMRSGEIVDVYVEHRERIEGKP